MTRLPLRYVVTVWKNYGEGPGPLTGGLLAVNVKDSLGYTPEYYEDTEYFNSPLFTFLLPFVFCPSTMAIFSVASLGCEGQEESLGTNICDIGYEKLTINLLLNFQH